VLVDLEFVLEAGGDLAVGVDHKGHTLRDREEAAEDAVGRADAAAAVGDQGKGELVSLGELALDSGFVEAHPDDLSTQFADLRVVVAKTARLFGTAGCKGFGIEIEHQVFAPEGRKRDVFSVRGAGAELRCEVAYFDGHGNALNPPQALEAISFIGGSAGPLERLRAHVPSGVEREIDRSSRGHPRSRSCARSGT